MSWRSASAFARKARWSAGDDRVDDGLQLLHRLGVLGDLAAEFRAVDAAICANDAGKRPFDRATASPPGA